MELIKILVFKLILASSLYFISTSASFASFENCKLELASGEDLVLLNRSSGEGDSFGYMKCGSRYFGKVHEVGVQYCFFNSYTINDAEVLKEGSFLGYDSDCEGYDGDSLLLFKGFKPKQTREIIGEIFHYWVFLSDQRYKFLLENVGWFNRNYSDDFNKFFSFIQCNPDLRSSTIWNRIEYFSKTENIVQFTMFIGDSGWSVVVDFDNDKEILSIYELIY